MQDKVVKSKPPRMVRKQILITLEQSRRLKALAAAANRPESELARDALDAWLEKQVREEDDWKAAWRQAAGMWKDRDDLDELMPRLRRSWDRPTAPDAPRPRRRK